jgi:ABC-type transport system involved in multi-copper enzyme maturation permease subunit
VSGRASDERAQGVERVTDSLNTIWRLVQADVMKLSRYWVVIAGYLAIAIVAIPGAIVFHMGEQAMNVTSASGYEFAFSLMVRCLDFSSSVLFVMLCIIFSIDVSNSTIKYILTRPVTRIELLLSKYAVAGLMVVITLALLWAACLGAGAYYYGLGALRENDYLLFEASVMYRNIGMASVFLAIALGAQASMAVAISAHSSTMGGAIIIGLILYMLCGAFSVIPPTLGFEIGSGTGAIFVPYSIVAFTSQLVVPMVMLDDLPAGVDIENWWNGDIRRLVFVCGSVSLAFFGLAAARVRNRDFTL